MAGWRLREMPCKTEKCLGRLRTLSWWEKYADKVPKLAHQIIMREAGLDVEQVGVLRDRWLKTRRDYEEHRPLTPERERLLRPKRKQ